MFVYFGVKYILLFIFQITQIMFLLFKEVVRNLQDPGFLTCASNAQHSLYDNDNKHNKQINLAILHDQNIHILLSCNFKFAR